MNPIQFLLNLTISVAFLFLLGSCNHSRQVVPYDVDIEKVLKALEPNDADIPDRISFGSDSIPGFIFEEDFTTKENDIYVFFENFTILDSNPGITESLLEFVGQQLEEYGFISPNDSIKPMVYQDYLAEGLSYSQAVDAYIDRFKDDFGRNYQEISKNGNYFNITFQIYPVYIDNEYVTYRESSYCYTGGAHGMTVSYLHTYSLESGKCLGLNDIVKSEYIAKIREDVAAQMAYSYPIYENIKTVDQYIDSLNVWLDNFSDDNKDMVTLENFPLPDPALVEEGLAFLYEMYELTPGSDCCPLVVVPYQDLRGALKVADK